MKQLKAKIISNTKVGPERCRLRCEAPAMTRLASPGQFLMVKCNDGPEPFLRRPFAFHSIGKHSFDILYQIVGSGTEALSLRKKGEALDIIGPLGNGFNKSQVTSHKSQIILIAGGIGIAPLLALGQSLPKSVRKNSIVIIGGSTAGHILCVNEFKKSRFTVKIATEDGSKGHKGLATDLLRAKLVTCDLRLTTIYACGPREMLKEAAKIAARHGAQCEVSLEEKMGCGTGVCIGCAVRTVLGQRLVCKDGPVFRAGDIIW